MAKQHLHLLVDRYNAELDRSYLRLGAWSDVAAAPVTQTTDDSFATPPVTAPYDKSGDDLLKAFVENKYFDDERDRRPQVGPRGHQPKSSKRMFSGSTPRSSSIFMHAESIMGGPQR